jgi:hypothetical protein
VEFGGYWRLPERLRKTERKRAVSGFAVIQSEGWSERLDGVVLRDFLGFLQGGFWWVQRILLPARRAALIWRSW